jgi:SNF2 family DNA or RNA helicase
VIISCSVVASLMRTEIVDGSMNQKERQKVVDKIKTDKNTRIILMSFKAGGVGKSLP